ncbi:protein PSK SIMULATOR 2-like [Syzygium oleosum]|uniref:protein PSK SIMULATOR 2-like n=1 Tax=Syzygium oleosum TaxID=219896 RepID=UPI0024B9A580|nr:protein PSK SIMULATOR 2-like [Syzygium oleosum]
MGGVCSGRVILENEKPGTKIPVVFSKVNSVDGFTKQQGGSSPNDNGNQNAQEKCDSVELELKQPTPSTPRKTANKANQKSSPFGRVGILSIKRAVKVLDTLESSNWNFNVSKGLITGAASRGCEILILAFEVANTIVKGANLLRSLSEKQLQLLKEEIITSEGVQNLVSTDTQELLTIAAADKREDLEYFLREVIRFGDQCKDPQWHNLGQYFSKLDSDNSRCKLSCEEAETSMQQLSSLAQQTVELYHALNGLERFERDYQSKLKEAESYNLPLRGEDLMNLERELKHQKKFVKSLKKRSLWSMTMEEIMAMFVNIVAYMHQRMMEAFGDNGKTSFIEEYRTNNGGPQRLGKAGLALHYANIVEQIDMIASHPAALPPNVRSTLYHALPTVVKTALRSHLQSIDAKDQLPISHVKAEINKTLKWIVPLATNTIKAHEGFGWVGDWAKTSKEAPKNTSTRNGMIRLQTLYHADKEKAELYILELAIWLHHLVTMVKQRIHAFQPLPIRSTIHKGKKLPPKVQPLMSP